MASRRATGTRKQFVGQRHGVSQVSWAGCQVVPGSSGALQVKAVLILATLALSYHGAFFAFTATLVRSALQPWPGPPAVDCVPS